MSKWIEQNKVNNALKGEDNAVALLCLLLVYSDVAVDHRHNSVSEFLVDDSLRAQHMYN